MTLQIVTATSGIVLRPLALRTASTRWVCSDRRWEGGKLALVTLTGNLPLGSFASCRWPLPHAVKTSAASTAQIGPMLLEVTAGRT